MSEPFKVVAVTNREIWMGGFRTIEAADSLCDALRDGKHADFIYLIRDHLADGASKDRVIKMIVTGY